MVYFMRKVVGFFCDDNVGQVFNLQEYQNIITDALNKDSELNAGFSQNLWRVIRGIVPVSKDYLCTFNVSTMHLKIRCIGDFPSSKNVIKP